MVGSHECLLLDEAQGRQNVGYVVQPANLACGEKRGRGVDDIHEGVDMSSRIQIMLFPPSLSPSLRLTLLACWLDGGKMAATVIIWHQNTTSKLQSDFMVL